MTDVGPPPPAPDYVATLWFAALVCGLSAATIAISVNQWLNNLLTPTALSSNGSHEQLQTWNLRHQTFREWRLLAFIDVPSVLLQTALVLFLVGLVGYLWQLNHDVAIPTLILVVILLLFLLSTTLIPVFADYSPFISPQSKFLCWVSVLMKVLYYDVALRTIDWLVLRPSAPTSNLSIGNFSRFIKLRRRLVPRRDNLQVIRKYGYHSWAARESMYLRTPTGRESDNALVANMLHVVKDDDSSISFITSCLHAMQLDLALKNIITLCQRRPPSPPDPEETPWQHVIQPQGRILSTSLQFAAQAFTNTDLDVPQEQAIDVYDHALVALRGHRGGRDAYLQLFDFLRGGAVREEELRMKILWLLYRNDDYFTVKAEYGEWRSFSCLRHSHRICVEP